MVSSVKKSCFKWWAVIIALIFVSAVTIIAPSSFFGAAEETASAVQSDKKLVDFDNLMTRFEPAKEGFTSTKANKGNFVTGGNDLPNNFVLNISSAESEDKLSGALKYSAAADLVDPSRGGATGDLWAAMGKPWEHGSEFSADDIPLFKDYKSIYLRVKITNFSGIEKIQVRLSDDTVSPGKDWGMHFVFRTSSFREGWQYLEIDIKDMSKLDGFNLDLKSGDGGELKINYLQVLTMFNKEATPAEIVFDNLYLSPNSVSPVMTVNASVPTVGETGKVTDFTGGFDVFDNRTDKENITYSLSATVGENDEIVPSSRIDGLKLNPNKPGITKVTVTAADEDGNEGKLIITITVTGNIIDITAPVIDISSLNQYKIMTTVTEVDLNTVSATDDVASNPVTLSFEVTDPENKPVELVNKKFTPTQNGDYKITIRAQDPSENASSRVFKISVSAFSEKPSPANPTKGCASIAPLSGGIGGLTILLGLSGLSLLLLKKKVAA